MYTASELEKASMAMDEPMKALSMRIMSDIVRRIQENGEITSAADWQINRLVQLGMGMAEIQAAIDEALSETENISAVLFKNVIKQGYVRDKKLYKAVNKVQIPFDDNAPLQQLISAVTAQTNETMHNITQSLGFAKRGTDGHLSFTPMAKYYQETMDKAMLDISSGAFDYNTVLKRTVKEMTNSGVRTVDYATGWSNRVDVAARRSVMTGMTQLTAQVNEQAAEDLETDWFEISWHGGARPDHWWGGKWYTKEQLKTICKLGDVTGLCGVNCRHSYSPVIPGISEPTYTPEELEELNRQEQQKTTYNGVEYTKYEATQKQRRLETTMRAQREEMALLKEGGADEDDLINCRARYMGTSHQYAEFSKAMGLPQQRERVYADGLGNIMEGKTEGGSGKESPIKVPPVGAKVNSKVTPEERKELLSRDKVFVHNSSIDNFGESGIMESSGIHAIGDDTSEPYEPDFAYDARVKEDVLRAVSEECDIMSEKFGKFDTVKGVDILQTKGTDEAAYNDNSGWISLRHANKDNALKEMSVIASQKKQSGMWSTGHPRHAIRHEIGHAIQKYHKDNDPKWEEKRMRIRLIMKQAQEKANNYEMPSIYSNKNEFDFISECIAASISKKPSKTVRDVVSVILEV